MAHFHNLYDGIRECLNAKGVLWFELVDVTETFIFFFYRKNQFKFSVSLKFFAGNSRYGFLSWDLNLPSDWDLAVRSSVFLHNDLCFPSALTLSSTLKYGYYLPWILSAFSSAVQSTFIRKREAPRHLNFRIYDGMRPRLWLVNKYNNIFLSNSKKWILKNSQRNNFGGSLSANSKNIKFHTTSTFFYAWLSLKYTFLKSTCKTQI